MMMVVMMHVMIVTEKSMLLVGGLRRRLGAAHAVQVDVECVVAGTLLVNEW